MSSIYTGIGDVLGPNAPALGESFFQRNYERIRVAQVLDAIVDSSSPYYTSEIGFGVIRFRFIPEHYRRPEELINFFAFPIDRSSYTVPLPGEGVLIYPSFVGNKLTYMYGQIIQLSANNAYNVEPFAATTADRVGVDVLDLAVDEQELALRFEKKLQIPIETYKANTPYVRLLREGDSIIEGRFGSSLYFSSTQEKNILQSIFKAPNIGRDELRKSLTSEDGDPIVILQANKRDFSSGEAVIPVAPSINDDMSSIYLTSTQVIPMRVMGSEKMLSWNVSVVTSKQQKRPVQVTEDTATALLTEGFPDRYDPNQAFSVNLNVAIGGATGGGLSGGGTAGAALGLPESEALSYDLILSHEGTILEAMWDIANWRIGHGSSTFTLADGTIIKLPGNKSQWPSGFDQATKQLIFTDIGNEVETKGKFHKNGYIWVSKNSGRIASPLITQADADRDLARRVKEEFLPDTKKDVVKACRQANLDGETVWTNLGKGAHAALCSIKYNYGNVTQNGAAKAAAQSQGNKDTLASWIENELQGGSKDRHRDEAFTCRTGQVSR